jgi:GT2 family glycosyltransferase
VPGPSLPLTIVHWNQPERCAHSVTAFLEQDVAVQVTVVDNASEPSAVDELARALPTEVDLVRLPRNTGFSGAANEGYRRFLADPGAGEWIGLAPHDALPEPGCLRRLLDAAAERPRAGLVSADFGDGASPVVDRYFGGILAPAKVEEGWEDVGHPHGTLMLASRGCLDEIGIFDERYFAYCEEADLALRARDAGWEVGLVRGAIIRNPYVGSRSAAIDYLQLRNTLLLVREHFGRYPATIRFLLAMWQLAAGAAVPSQRGPYFDGGARLQALADHARGRYGPPPAALLRRSG